MKDQLESPPSIMITMQQAATQATVGNQMEEYTLNDFVQVLSQINLLTHYSNNNNKFDQYTTTNINIKTTIIYNIIVMFELQSDHIHTNQPPTTLQKIDQSQEIQIPVIPKKKIRKVRIKTLPTNDPNQHYYADALIPQLEIAMSEIEGVVFEVISEVRKKVQFKVYTGIVEDQEDFLRRLFNTDNQSRYWIRQAIRQTSNQVTNNIIKDIFSGDLQVHKINKISKDDIFNNGRNNTQTIKMRQQMLKAKLSSFKADLSGSSHLSSADIFNSDLFSADNQKTKQAAQFIKRMQQEQEQIRQHYQKIKQNQKYKNRKNQQERRQIELRLKEERHQFLRHQYEEKRKMKAKEREDGEKKEEEFREYLKEYKKKKPLFKKNQEQYFQKFLVPENKKKLEILQEIREEHKPLSHEELLEHEKQYFQIKNDHIYEKNAQRAMETKARGPYKNYYKSKFHSVIASQQQERMNMQDPLEQKTNLYHKRWQYATEIKTKFRPKISQKKQNQIKKRQQEQNSPRKIANRRSSDAYKHDGKHNLDQLHKYIAELRAKGKVRHASASHTIQHSPKIKYRNYLREAESSSSRLRHSIDYSSLAETDGEKLKFNLKKLESDAIRREQYLTHLGSYDMDKYMNQKKRLDQEYLETVRAKMALINKYS